MSATQSYLLSNQPAGNYIIDGSPASAWKGYNGGLLGGTYAFIYVGSGTGTASLQVLGPDGVTWTPVGSSITANSGSQTLQLTLGQYRIAITGFSANYANLTKIPK